MLRRPRRARAASAPPFRFSRIGPRGRALGAAGRLALARRHDGGRRRSRRRAGRLHLPRPVHRPRPDHGPHRRVLGEDVRRPSCCRAARPRSTSTRCTAPGPATRSRRSSTTRTGCTSRPGRRSATGPDRAKPGHDLPRVGTGASRARRKALIPDPRNDENLIVAQTHLAMIRFHNRVVDRLPASVPAPQRFRRARKSVTLHYQWLIRHDYLPRIVDPAVAGRRVHQRTQGRRAGRRGDRPAHDAGRVLRGGVPARPQHDPARLRLEPAVPGAGWASSTTCSSSRPPGATSAAPTGCSATGSPTGAGCTTSRRRAPRPGRARRRQHGPADRHAAHRPAEEPAAQHVRRRRRRSRSTTGAATWPSAT